MTTAMLGVDLGGTVVKAAVVDAGGDVSGLVTAPSAERQGPDAWLHAALDLAQEARSRAVVVPAGAGLSVPGAVDAEAAVLVDLVDRLPTGDGVDLAGSFAPLGLPVAADNDARAALEAERRWGLAAGWDNVVMLTIGTGLGCAALVRGEPPGGERILGGNQLGHVTIDLDGPRCVCGNHGCGEIYASATGLIRRAEEAGLRDVAPAEVFAARDARAADIVDRFVLALGTVVVNAVHAYQPDLIVLSGGLMGSAESFLPGVRRLVSERAWTLPRGRVQVEASALGERIGVLGGAAVAFARAATTERRVG